MSVHLTPIAEDMLEEPFQKLIIDLAHTLGWLVHHARPAPTRRRDARGREKWVTPIQGDPGFPDLVLARRGRVIIAELKRRGQSPTAKQRAWLEQLGLEKGIPDVELYVWRPADWLNIGKILT